MSDSEDEAAFASADEGDDKTQEQLMSKPTEEKQKEQPKTKEEKDKSQNQGKSKNVKAENPNPAKGKGKSQEQVKTQPQSKQQGGKKGKGGKGKKTEKKGKSEETTTDKPVSEPTAAKSLIDTEESIKTETEEGVQTETDKQSKTQDKITQEKTATESTELRLSEKSTESNEKDEIKPGESGEPKELTKDNDDKLVVGKSEKDSSESKSTEDKESKKDPKSALDQLTTDKEAGDSWSWGNWGSSLIDVASSSVSTFTHQVGEGFNTIMDTVETSLGAPSPEELILLQGIKEKDEEVIKTAPEDTSMDRAEDIDKEEEEKKSKEETKETGKESEKSSTASGTSGGGGGGWFSSWGMSSLTSVVQNTTNIVQNKSKHLVSGGLDVLETIGKKTMDVIKDHDPGLTLTKSLFLTNKGDKQNLSMILREAKEEAAKKAEQEKEFEETREAHFGCMFDEILGSP